MMEKLQAYSSPTNLTDFEITQLCQDTMCVHEKSSNDTWRGNHGESAEFWTNYIDLVQIYLHFCCDHETFIYSLGCMNPALFATSHANYALHIVKYELDSLNIDTSLYWIETIAMGWGICHLPNK